MKQRVTLTFEFEDGELDEFPHPLFDWAFGEICQNLGFGYLTNLRVEDIEDEGSDG